MNERGTITTSIVCAAVLIFAIFIWPTIYKYEKIKVGNSELLVKINRLNGYTERFIKGKWVSENKENTTSKETMSDKKIVKLPQEELNQLDGSGNYSDIMSNYYAGEVYNGTENWIITDIVLKIIQEDKNGNVLSENRYKHTLDSPLEPLKSEDIGFNAVSISARESVKAELVEAYGYKVNNTK